MNTAMDVLWRANRK